MVHIFGFLSYRGTQKKLIPFILTFAVLVTGYIMADDDLITLVIFAALILAFSIFRFDSRIPIIFAILLLIITGVLISLHEGDLASRLAVQSYLLLVAGIICMLIDLCRRKRAVQTVA